MRWRLAWLGAALSGCVLGAQPSISITALWDLDPSHDTPGLTWELERDGVIHPCGPVTVTATDRRCTATVPAATGVYRLRGLTATGEPGPWSGTGSGTQTAPGQFTITWNSPITLTEPEPGGSMAAYVSAGAQTADLTSAGGNVDITLDVGSGSDRAVWAYVVYRSDRGTLTGVTYAGVALSQVGSDANSGNFRGRLYRLVGPASGPNTLRASFTGSGGNFPVWFTGIALNTVDGTTPEDTLVHEVESGSDAATTQDISTSSATGDRVITGAWFGTNGFDTTGSVSGGSYTIRQQVLHSGAGARIIIGDADGAATVTPATTYNNNVGAWNALRWAVNVNAAGGGSASGALAVPALTASAAVSVGRTAGASLVIPSAELSAMLAVARTTFGTLAAPSLSAAADAGVGRSASGALQVPAPTLSAAATTVREAAGALVVPASVLAAAAAVARTASGDLSVPVLMLAGVSESGRTVSAALLVPATSLAAAAAASREATGALVVPVSVLAAGAARQVGASGALQVPTSVLAAAAAVQHDAAGALQAPLLVLTASASGAAATASGALVVPVPALTAGADTARTAVGALAMPAAALVAEVSAQVNAGAALSVPAVTLAAAAAAERSVSGAAGVPALALFASLATGRTASGALAAPLPTLTASANNVRQVAAALGMPAVTLAAAADRAVQAGAALLVPAPTLAASAATARTALAAMNLPELVLSSTAIEGVALPVQLTHAQVVSITPNRSMVWIGPVWRTEPL